MKYSDYYAALGVERGARPMKSRRPIGASRRSIIRTSPRSRAPRRNSRKSPRRTRRSRIPRSARPTTRSEAARRARNSGRHRTGLASMAAGARLRAVLVRRRRISPICSRASARAARSSRRRHAGPGLRSARGDQHRRRVSRHHVVAVAFPAGIRRGRTPAARAAHGEGAHRTRRRRRPAPAPARQGRQGIAMAAATATCTSTSRSSRIACIARSGTICISTCRSRRGKRRSARRWRSRRWRARESQGAGGHLGGPQAAARGPRAAEAARWRGRSHSRWRRSSCPASLSERERELYRQLGRIERIQPTPAFRRGGHMNIEAEVLWLDEQRVVSLRSSSSCRVWVKRSCSSSCTAA